MVISRVIPIWTSESKTDKSDFNSSIQIWPYICSFIIYYTNKYSIINSKLEILYNYIKWVTHTCTC